MKFIHLIDNIAINFLFFENLIIMKDLKRSYNLIIDLSKFTSNKKILKYQTKMQPNSVYPKLYTIVGKTLENEIGQVGLDFAHQFIG